MKFYFSKLKVEYFQIFISVMELCTFLCNSHIDVNFYIKYEGHQTWSKLLSMDILRIFGDQL